MRFVTLALSVLGLAGFAVGEASHSSSHVRSSKYSLTRTIPGDPLPTRSIGTSPLFTINMIRTESSQIINTNSNEIFSAEHIRTKPAEVVPTVDRRQEDHSIYTESCGYGYTPISTTRTYISCSSYWSGGIDGGRKCTATATWPGMGCTQTYCPSGYTPAPPTVTSGTVECIQTWPPYSRTHRSVAQFAARSTQDLGGRSQRYVARFASPTVTTKPDEAVATPPPFPICSFDLSKGQYICPKATKLPICSFNLSKGQYICPDMKEAKATPLPLVEKEFHVDAETTLKTVKKA